jgi:hypothetical protein
MFLVGACCLVAAGVPRPAHAGRGAAEARGPAAAPQAVPTDEALFSSAAQAVASGKADQLLAAADAVLARTPDDRRAAASKIAVLLASSTPKRALEAYSAWTSAARREDEALLVRVARGVLVDLEAAQLAEIRGRALEARARRGDATARKTLEARRAARPETPDSWEATLALARMGDAPASQEVARAVADAVGSRKAAALAAVRGVPTTPVLVEAIADALTRGDDVVKDAAAEAAIDRRAPALVEPLEAVVATARFTAPLRAAVALMRMDDLSGRALVDANLAGDLADGRIVAARAYAGRPDTGWAARLEPVLKDPNPLLRILAAELLLPVRPREAMQAIGPELVEENPVLRAEATRVAAGHPATALEVLHAALADEAPWVRFHAAEALARRPAEGQARQGPAPGRKRPR